jgi:hypothetical protein
LRQKGVFVVWQLEHTCTAARRADWSIQWEQTTGLPAGSAMCQPQQQSHLAIASNADAALIVSRTLAMVLH